MLLLGGGLNEQAFGSDLSECMMQMIEQVDGKTAIDELRLQCEKKIHEGQFHAEEQADAVISARLRHDQGHVLQPFTLMAHRPNYILLGTYNSVGYNPQPYRDQNNDQTLQTDDSEAQFQISIKTPLAIDLFGKFDIYAAYTNRSFWQVYNTDTSSPFRETNHEPEFWAQFRPNWHILGFTNTVNGLGIVHQSNGRGGVLSRSWNRIYASFVMERGNFALAFKPWYRIKEDIEDDDNRDITDYLGHHELRAGLKLQEHVLSLMLRNNLESGFEKGAVELGWSFPLGSYPYLKGYVQYFTGYGESLIDYNHYVNRVGIGVALTDFL